MISKNKSIAIISVGILICLFCFSLFIGNYEIDFIKGLNLLLRNRDIDSLEYKIIWNLRIPRAVMAIIIGMLLGCSMLHRFHLNKGFATICLGSTELLSVSTPMYIHFLSAVFVIHTRKTKFRMKNEPFRAGCISMISFSRMEHFTSNHSEWLYIFIL